MANFYKHFVPSKDRALFGMFLTVFVNVTFSCVNRVKNPYCSPAVQNLNPLILRSVCDLCPSICFKNPIKLYHKNTRMGDNTILYYN